MLITSCVLIIIGAVLIIFGRLWDMKIEKTERYRGRTTGVVAEIVPGQPDAAGIRSGVHDYYYPVITFYANGRLYKEEYEKGSNPCDFFVNQELELCYDERCPEHFYVIESARVRRAAKIVYSLGFIFCCAGGIFFLLFATRG